MTEYSTQYSAPTIVIMPGNESINYTLCKLMGLTSVAVCISEPESNNSLTMAECPRSLAIIRAVAPVCIERTIHYTSTINNCPAHFNEAFHVTSQDSYEHCSPTYTALIRVCRCFCVLMLQQFTNCIIIACYLCVQSHLWEDETVRRSEIQNLPEGEHLPSPLSASGSVLLCCAGSSRVKVHFMLYVWPLPYFNQIYHSKSGGYVPAHRTLTTTK